MNTVCVAELKTVLSGHFEWTDNGNQVGPLSIKKGSIDPDSIKRLE